jgi:hypothetical protein
VAECIQSLVRAYRRSSGSAIVSHYGSLADAEVLH